MTEIDHAGMHALELQTLARLIPHLDADGLREERHRLRLLDRDTFGGNVAELHAEVLDAVTRAYATAEGLPLAYFASVGDLLEVAPDDLSTLTDGA